jgi:hypothetical protein
MMRLVLIAGMIVLVGLIAPANAATQNVVTTQLSQASASIAQFNHTHATASLDNALQSLANAGSQRLEGSDRASVTSVYLTLFAAIDQAMPHLPPGKLPKISILPPPVNGISYPAGIDPSAIPDPQARARYQEAIRENEAFTAQFLKAFSLRQVDMRATMLFSNFAHDAFNSTQTDQNALRHQIEASGLSAETKHRLLTAALST